MEYQRGASLELEVYISTLERGAGELEGAVTRSFSLPRQTRPSLPPRSTPPEEERKRRACTHAKKGKQLIAGIVMFIMFLSCS